MELMVDYICKKDKYFVAGTDTGVGKTFVTRLLAKYYKMQGYKVGTFKPVESGILENNTPDYKLLSEASGDKPKILYKLTQPLAPLIAAKIDNIEIDVNKIIQFAKDDSKKFDIYFVEAAGGLFVPVTEKLLMIDIIKMLQFEVILVARTNLGTVNHTLLSIEALQNRDIPINQVILNEVVRTPEKNIQQNIYMIESFSNIKVSKVIRNSQKSI